MTKLTVNQLMRRAAALHKKGEIAEARSIYQSILSTYPNNRRAQRAVATILLPEAKPSANSENLPKEQLGKLNALYSQNRFDEVLALAKQLIKQYPSSFVLWNFLGAGAAQREQFPLALEAYKRAARLHPKDANIHFSMGVTLQEMNKYDSAVKCYRRALQLRPDHKDTYNNLGNVLKEQGKLDEAVEAYETALKIAPNSPHILCNLGNALREKDTGAAIRAYEAALKVKPDHEDALFNLGNALQDQNDSEAAIRAYEAALKINPDHVDAFVNMGNVMKSHGKLDGAVKAFKCALRLQRDHAGALYNLGLVLEEQGKLEKSEIAFRSAIDHHPEYVNAYLGLSLLYQQKRAPKLAHKVALKATRIDGKSAAAHVQVGSCLADMHEVERAEEAYAKALEINPKFQLAYILLGNLANEQGDVAKARTNYEEAISCGSVDMLRGHLEIVNLAKITAGDKSFTALEAASKDGTHRHPEHLISMHYSLGKGYADQKRYDDAWHSYEKAAAIRRARITYDPQEFDDTISQIIEVMTPDRLAEMRGAAVPDATPIFVLGMPRSGTTLTESILASHSSVFGAGELGDLVQLLPPRADRDAIQYPECIRQFAPTAMSRLAEDYLSRLKLNAPQAQRITDKMPANFLYVGLLHALLPNARIVHTTRDPMDTCFSCFTQNFKRTQLHSYEQTEIARYYNGYQRLMAHWRSVLPDDAFLDFSYEELVADFEGQARRLVGWVGLPWEEKCLNFHRVKRNVRTASVNQVRQPIYATSLKKWENYRKHLAPMMETLNVK